MILELLEVDVIDLYNNLATFIYLFTLVYCQFIHVQDQSIYDSNKSGGFFRLNFFRNSTKDLPDHIKLGEIIKVTGVLVSY
jgi:hypothetical protein